LQQGLALLGDERLGFGQNGAVHSGASGLIWCLVHASMRPAKMNYNFLGAFVPFDPEVPVISDLDIWRAAVLLIRQHGKDAELQAARKADLMLERCDREGQLLWQRIRQAIVELQAPPSGPGH